jgi:phosphatidylethanolamine/phosphatidyl-N-methylethanolamine N-methyltransferase
MSALLFKRFLINPVRVACIVPSSKALIRRVCSKMDFSTPKVIVEFGPGEGCHTQEILKRMHHKSRLMLFELDEELAVHLRRQFQEDNRVEVFHSDAIHLPQVLAECGIAHCDYVVSGIPFSILELNKKRKILQSIYDSLSFDCNSAFLIYQITAELRKYAKHFPRIEQEYCLQNFPPMFVIKFYKQALNKHPAIPKKMGPTGTD